MSPSDRPLTEQEIKDWLSKLSKEQFEKLSKIILSPPFEDDLEEGKND